MKVALVYDHVNRVGGAERVLAALQKLYPEAPLFTCVYNPELAPWARSFQVKTSFLQHIPFANKFHEFFPGIPYLAMESFDFSGFNVVISVTSAEGKSIITSPKTLHICYCLTPTRYLWSHYHDYFNTKWLRGVTLPFVSILRIYDILVAQRPDVMVAISETVSLRIHHYYRRKSQVIYPPVDLNLFKPSDRNPKDYYLVVSRLVRYKHIELVIEACNRLKRNLKIVGSGPESNNLRKISGPTIEFLGNLMEAKLIGYYQDCRALIFPQEEDFGITQIEALACGRPVITYKKGAALEIQKEGITGEFFTEQKVESLIAAIKRMEAAIYDPVACRTHVLKFDTIHFLQNFTRLVNEEWNRYNSKYL